VSVWLWSGSASCVGVSVRKPKKQDEEEKRRRRERIIGSKRATDELTQKQKLSAVKEVAWFNACMSFVQ